MKKDQVNTEQENIPSKGLAGEKKLDKNNKIAKTRRNYSIGQDAETMKEALVYERQSWHNIFFSHKRLRYRWKSVT